MSKTRETIKAELKAIYTQLTNEEKTLLAKKKQNIVAARDTKSENTEPKKQ